MVSFRAALSRTTALAVFVLLSGQLAACSETPTSSGAASGATTASRRSAPAAAAPRSPPATPASQGGLSLEAVNGAVFAVQTNPADQQQVKVEGGNVTGDGSDASHGPKDAKPDAALIRAEVLLDRANFSPGVIDGRLGENVSNALVAFEKAHGLPASRELNPQAWQALTSGDSAPVLKRYSLTAQDVAGPWTPDIGENFVKMAELSQVGYLGPAEMLAERFHMDQALLKALNPGADFSKAGADVVVVDPGSSTLPEAASLEVDKQTKSVSAFDADHKLLAVFPATVGSTERPSPKGTWKVKGVAQHPDYTYDPSKLTWGPKKAGKLHIPPGPKGPVGVVWIALSAPDYGIHGTPDPRMIGKTASHGCVRLTNWDAEELSHAVKPGVKVTFVS